LAACISKRYKPLNPWEELRYGGCANVKAVQLMLGHASAAMTLDIYAGLFADDLDAVADRLDRAFVKLNADQMRTKRRTSWSDQTELPFENPPEQGTG
jgi:hypothetical protein